MTGIHVINPYTKKPVTGANVTLTDESGYPAASNITDDDGKVVITNGSGSGYFWEVRKDGFQGIRTEVIPGEIKEVYMYPMGSTRMWADFDVPLTTEKKEPVGTKDPVKDTAPITTIAPVTHVSDDQKLNGGRSWWWLWALLGVGGIYIYNKK